MTREEKQTQVKDLHEKFSTATVAILAEFNGLKVEEITELRRKLRSAEGELKVVKNNLAIRAVDGTPLSETKPSFVGPVAVAFGYADPVPATKIVQEFSDEKDKFKIKIGVIEGRVIDSKNIKFVARLPAKEVLIANLVSQLQAPITGIVFVLEGMLQQFVGVLEAIKEKKGPATE